MNGCLTGAQKFWCLVCIIWLICIIWAYRDDLRKSARPAIVIVFIGGLPMMVFLVTVARIRYRNNRTHRSGNEDAESSMVVISPEQRESPHGNLYRNPGGIDDRFLMMYVYRTNGRAAEGNDCVVCLSQLQNGEKVVKIEFCSHLFHEDCIDRWLRLHKTCPVCRSRVDGEETRDFVVRVSET